MELYWSKRAEDEFAQNLEFLEEKWGFISAARFFEVFNSHIESIKANPNRFQYHDRKRNIQKCQVVKQISIYYTYDGKDIYLLSVFNNWRDPDKLDL